MSSTATAGLGEWMSPTGSLEVPSSNAKWVSTMTHRLLWTGSQSICFTMARMEQVLGLAKMVSLPPPWILHTLKIQHPTAWRWAQSHLLLTPRLTQESSKAIG